MALMKMKDVTGTFCGGKVNSGLFLWSIFSTMFLVLSLWSSSYPAGDQYRIFHGGNPNDIFHGSCYCGIDKYCMCTPSLAIDAIIEVANINEANHSIVHSLVLVNRGVPPKGYALPGGFVNVGESVEDAVVREVKEETNLDIETHEQFRVYSDPRRDKRRHTASAVFICRVYDDKPISLKRGDDAKGVVIVPINEIIDASLAFDHRTILMDYFKLHHPTLLKKG